MTRTLAQSFHVHFEYPVRFTTRLLDPANPVLAQAVGGSSSPARLLAVLDAGLIGAHPELPAALAHYARAHRLDLLATLHLPGGEAAKQDPAHVQAVQRAIHDHGLDRHAYVLAVGGGALIDAVGYAAATAHRGVRLVRIPSTVLSQNDSAVGVKNSVNAYGKKNWLGTFAPPAAVLNDLQLLTTLEDRDWLGGLSEAVKVALLGDAAFFRQLERDAARLRGRDLSAMESAVYRCAELHLRHIAGGDPFEQGSSRPLDFGHWAAHKLEALSGYRLRHGEAVAIGIALDSTYSYLRGLLPEGDWRRILALFSALGLAVTDPLMTHAPETQAPEQLLAGLEEFREHLGGELTIMLLEGIGQGVEVHEMDHDVLRASIRLLNAIPQEDPAWTPMPVPAR